MAIRVLNSVDGWHKGGDGPVCSVGEEQYGLQTVMEVEDVRGWKRFWVRVENFFQGKAHEDESSRKTDRGLRFWGNWFHTATPA